jgi:hypothetical protein
LAALINAWNKLGDIQNIIALMTWIIGVTCFIVLAQYWRWQKVHHLSLVTIQTIMASKKETSLDECNSIWDTVNETDLPIRSFLNPFGRFGGVEICVIYLFALMTLVPSYLFCSIVITSFNSKIGAFALAAIIYIYMLAFLSSVAAKESCKFNANHWMFRWIDRNSEIEEELSMNTKEVRSMIDMIRDADNKELVVVSLFLLPILLGGWSFFLNNLAFLNQYNGLKLLVICFLLILYAGGLFYMKRDTIEDKLKRARFHIENRLKKRGGHRASFDAIRNEVNETYTDDFLKNLIDMNPEIFGSCTIKKGNKPGITLVSLEAECTQTSIADSH